MKIAVAGLIGYERAKALLDENEEVKKRLPKFFIERFNRLNPNAIALADSIPISDGGLFRSIWQLCEKYSEICGKKKGCEIDFKKIPISQEVIEIMEIVSENPYESTSKGAYLAYGQNFPKEYVIIGQFTEDNDRVIIFEDGKRFLTPPQRQEKDLNQGEIE